MADDDSNFDCGICLDKCEEPVVTQCGHLFCWPCLGKWLQRQQDCPTCKALCTRDNIIPVYGKGRSQSRPRPDGDSAPPRPEPSAPSAPQGAEASSDNPPDDTAPRPRANRPPTPPRRHEMPDFQFFFIWPFAMFEANTQPLGWNNETKSRLCLYFGCLLLAYLLIVA
eukprot:TRINITY_DN35941_c0_g1_i2.p1 TRINITY_DN35941_c0_g1~~TRINITY_DN35941_c0_g1_i2.p1  ORF type:complete len:175 (+),score=25.96 TRINITY_DN35941_c0_g1_i2:23-526(+)